MNALITNSCGRNQQPCAETMIKGPMKSSKKRTSIRIDMLKQRVSMMLGETFENTEEYQRSFGENVLRETSDKNLIWLMNNVASSPSGAFSCAAYRDQVITIKSLKKGNGWIRAYRWIGIPTGGTPTTTARPRYLIRPDIFLSWCTFQ
jgi:hypothetical protein